MDLDTLLIGTMVAEGIALTGLAISGIQSRISNAYISQMHRLKKEGRFNEFPLYAQEIYNASRRSLAEAGETPSLDTSFINKLKTVSHYQFAEFPTFRALYKFLTVDNPEWRPLF